MFPLSIEQIATIAAAVGTAFVLVWKKVGEMKLPDFKKEQSDILAHIRGEKADAIRQRDESVALNDKLRQSNLDLDRKVIALHQEVEAMKNKLILLTELNNRLATSLDLTRTRLEEYLRSSPQYGQDASLSPSAASQAAEVFQPEPETHRQKDFEEE